MATKREIQDHIAAKLILQDRRRLTGPFVEAAVLENITPGDWNAIAGGVASNNFAAIGKVIVRLIELQITADAQAEAATIVADDTVSFDEYSRIEGLP